MSGKIWILAQQWYPCYEGVLATFLLLWRDIKTKETYTKFIWIYDSRECTVWSMTGSHSAGAAAESLHLSVTQV